MKSANEFYGFLSVALLHNSVTVLQKEKGTQGGRGQEDMMRGVQGDSLREKKSKAGDGERGAAGTLTRQEKKVVGSQLFLHDDLLPLHTVTDTHKQHLPLLDYMPCRNTRKAAQKSLRRPESASQTDIFFTMCVKQTHTNSLVMEYKCLCESRLLLSLSLSHSVSLHVLSSPCARRFPLSASLCICFVLFSVLSYVCVCVCVPMLSRKEPVMVEPGERSNFAGSALFLSSSVVLSAVLRAPQDRRNSNSLNFHHMRAHTTVDFFFFFTTSGRDPK